jgi:hypothetical protein
MRNDNQVWSGVLRNTEKMTAKGTPVSEKLSGVHPETPDENYPERLADTAPFSNSLKKQIPLPLFFWYQMFLHS